MSSDKTEQDCEIATVIVRRRERLVDIVESPPSCAGAVEQHYALWIIAVCLVEVVYNMISSHFLATTSRSTYLHYINVDKIMSSRRISCCVSISPKKRDSGKVLEHLVL